MSTNLNERQQLAVALLCSGLSATETENTLKLFWIIESVISRRPLLFGDENNRRTKKHAFEACLFMLGYDTENLKVETNA